jgi:ribosomal protein S18 acetylase RimI-like enzyme
VGRTPGEIATRVTPAADGSICTFAVFADDELAGFVALIHPQRQKLRHGAELAGMYVAPEYRRRGYGQALMRAVIARAQSLHGVRQLKLGVNATNTAARQLYQSAGFIFVGMEPDALCVDGDYHDVALYLLRFTQAV